jgi:TRAP-type C4-dicarboxylate transport system permease large subunit
MASFVSSRLVFLVLLNIALLVVGCFMDIFSAVLVISPLVIPLGAAYGVHPVHLGVIFIMNLSIGFLTPPIGMNLFLASYAFDKPVMRIYKDVLPFFLVQLVVLALVTWIPWFSLAFVR